MSAPARLGLPSAAALVVASMVGSGVFTTSGFALADLGRPEPVLLAWVVGGVLAMCGAVSYGALARRFPESGGEYVFLARAVHPLAGFLAGWVSLLAGFTAPIAAAALGLQAYLGSGLGTSVRPEWLGTGAIAGAALLHGLHLRVGVAFQNAAVVLKLLLLAGFVVLGAGLTPDTTTVQLDALSDVSVGAFAVVLVWISFAYSGWNAAVYIAGEVRDPETNLPRALVLATGVVTLVYLAVNAVFLYAAPPEQLAGKAEVGAIAAQALGGDGLRRAISGVVALALFTSISSLVMAGPRVYAKMAEDGLFPRAFKSRGEVPAAAIALQAGLAVIAVWLTGLRELLGYIGLVLGFSAAATVAALMAVRLREGAERVPVPGFPLVPAVFVLGTLGAAGFMAFREPLQTAIAVASVAAGVPCYLWMRGSNQPGTRRSQPR